MARRVRPDPAREAASGRFYEPEAAPLPRSATFDIRLPTPPGRCCAPRYGFRTWHPPYRTRWSVRSMAKEAGISPAQVQRIWSGNEIKPHLTRTFKLSNDPEFETKFWDVVGLYLDPPAKALVLCCDEKSQCQALERSQPGLPLGIGHIRTRTHDYIRHGTITLFAALNYIDGRVFSTTAGFSPRRPSDIPTSSGSPF